MSDPFIHEMLQKAFAAHDRLLIEDAESDRRLEQLKKTVREKQRARGEVIHKVYDPDDPHRAATAQPQQQVADLSVEAQKRWDAWADAKIDRALLNFFKGHLKESIGALISELRREWKGEIKKAIGEFQRDFKLPVLRGWTPGFHREGSLVVAAGGLYQALRDTSHNPGHPDWQVVACPGHDGCDGRDADGKRRDSVVDLPPWPRGKRDVA